jgi:hypothetical protein
MSKTIVGVSLTKVDKKHLNEVATSLGIEPDGLSRTVEAVAMAFAKTGGKDLMVCNICGGASPKDLLSCPFCNDGEEETIEPAILVEPEPLAATDIDATKMEEGIVFDGTESPEQLEKVRKLFGKNAAKVEAKKGKAPKAAKAEMVVASSATTGALVTAAQAVEVLGPGERDLDAAVVRINTAKVLTAAGYFQLCKEIAIVQASQLWKARTQDGKPKYKTWGDFVQVELEMSKSTAWAMANVAEKYTLEQVKSIGQKKCELLLTAPKEAQAELLDAAARGESVRKLEGKIREMNLSRPGKRGRPQKPAKAEERKNELTIATLVGAKHALAFYEPGTKKDEEPKPAKKVKDGCWTFLNLPNGVQLTMRIVGIEAGKPKLLFAAKRED